LPGRSRISEPTIEPEALAVAIAERTRSALASGALQPIETAETTIDDADIRFVVRSVSSIARRQAAPANPNPFRPPEPALVVGDVSATHVAVLNKYPVVARHLLVVTREFTAQDTLLDHADFAAWVDCLRGIDGLGFYNGGREAGASQSHKHLQIVPLPLAAGPWTVPTEVLFDAWVGAGRASRLVRLPFANAFATLDASLFEPDGAGADSLLAHYQAMLESCGLRDEAANDDYGLAANEPPRQNGAYNLLLTRRWMLLVPRSGERFATISLNALAFAGSLFVRDESQMHMLREAGPMNALRAVAVPTGTPPPRSS
jgi:ATP adenylyltransferase